MPLLALWSAQNSARSSKSLYDFLLTRKPPLPLSATMAPPSARQFASPSRLKLSRPFSPSISVVQPPMLPGIIEQAATSVAASASVRFIGAPPRSCRRFYVLLQVAGEERADFADAVGPRLGVAAGGRAAAAGRRRVDARGHEAHRV